MGCGEELESWLPSAEAVGTLYLKNKGAQRDN